MDCSREWILKGKVSQKTPAIGNRFPFFLIPLSDRRILNKQNHSFGRSSFYRRVLSNDKKENFRSTFRMNFRDWTRSLFRSSLIPL
ncbi:hypothetical protein DLM78_06885 [Leptospira stimsonii]|uniref:Uncharacterized protein n=1 Tax=Leptospira stimsonii TaxID=2202203 RepID=A0A8B3CTQ2_9LEPT|nr:hypothetical protein DLM78_06885 [Leptospira stimsonii]